MQERRVEGRGGEGKGGEKSERLNRNKLQTF